MIDSREKSIEVIEMLQQMMMGDHSDIDPKLFWENVGWDADQVWAIAQVGAAMGMAGGDPDDCMVAMQMGAALTVAGLQKKKAENGEDSPRPFDHLKTS